MTFIPRTNPGIPRANPGTFLWLLANDLRLNWRRFGDLVGGQVNMVFSSVGPVEQHVRAGKLRAIAVTTPGRFAGMAGVPTMAESGLPQFSIGVWLGILAPLGTPKPVVARVNAEISKVLAVPEVRERFGTLGYEAVGGEPSLLRDRIEADYQKWGKLIREANIKGD